jgi:hypothetical protein
LPGDAESDLLVRVAAWGALAALGIAFLLTAQILVLRTVRNGRRERRRRIVEGWEPALLSALDPEAPAPLPPLRRRDVEPFLYLLNHHQEVLEGGVKERLNALAREAGAAPAARRLLRRRSVRSRLLAMQTLGNLRDVEAWDLLERSMDDPDPYVSVCAARALVRIDAARAAPRLAARVLSREDWSWPRVASLLAAAGPAHWSRPLAESLAAVPPSSLPRVLRFLEEGDPAAVLPAVRSALDSSRDVDTAVAALGVLGRHCDPDDLGRVRGRIEHPSAAVRLAAVVALGRLGTPADEPALRDRLSDPDGAVRYRAARALAGQPGMTRERLQSIAKECTDPFGLDVLVQVIEEGDAP